MTTPFTTYPAPAQSGFQTPNPADLWDYLIGKGLSEQDATRHVLLTIQNSPEANQREYLKDVDPGKLAAIGLGAADMMSFGLGDQFARKLEGQEAVDTQEAASTLHKGAHTVGEVLGLVGPAAVEYGLAKAGVLVPTAIGRAIKAIASKPVRLAAKTAVNAATGAGFAAAQAAGRAPPGQRLQAAKAVAPIGAVAGAALPFAIGGMVSGKRLLGRLTGPVADFVAGEGPAAAQATRALSGPPHIAGGVLDDISQALADRQAGRISAEDFNTAMGYRGGQGAPAPGLLNATPPALTPMPGSPTGLLGPEGYSPTPKASYPPSLVEMQGFPTGPQMAKPGHPTWYGEGSPTRSAEVRGGEPLLPSPNPEVAKALQGAPYENLQAALRKPETPQVIKNLILIEIQRRGIVGPGLLAPRQ